MHFTSSAANRKDVAGTSITAESFLLARVDYHVDANDDIYLWVNYDITQGEPLIGTAHASHVGVNNLAFDRIALRAGAASGGLASAQGFFDEVRIGMTFADVTPTGVGPDADFDEDGKVDAADLAAWKGGFGTSGAALHAQGDADGDLDVDGADFVAWQRQLEMTGSSAVGMAAPEPAAGMMLLSALLAMLSGRRDAAS
jgi:hypothetical protein